jgi:histidine decarboxylase
MTYQQHRSDQSLIVAADPRTITAEVAALQTDLDRAWARHLGFPGTADLHHTVLATLLTRYALNNIGDPFEDGLVPNHTKRFERQVLDAAAQLFRAPRGRWWGAVTNGSTEGNLMGVLAGRNRFPEAIVLHSAAAHYSVPKAARVLAMPSDVVAVDHHGEMNYDSLRAKLRQHRHRRPVIVATIGTTMTEAIDSVTAIVTACADVGITADRRHIHADAALSGIPLALLAAGQRPGFDLRDGADSIVTSGHKFLSTLMPSGIYLVKATTAQVTAAAASRVDYIGGHDTTISGSRSGHLPLLLWEALRRHGVDGLRRRAAQARQTAAYAEQALQNIGWPTWRNPLGFTVMLATPPAAISRRWALPTSGGWSHLITMPGVGRHLVDELIADLAACKPREVAVAQPQAIAVVGAR